MAVASAVETARQVNRTPMVGLSEGPLLAQARPTGSTGTPLTLGSLVGAALPDVLVYGDRRLNTPTQSNFVLANPLTAGYTQFISHTRGTPLMVGDVPLRRVETITYWPFNPSRPTTREDGLGYCHTFTTGRLKGVKFFANIRGGDTNLQSLRNGASLNLGFMGPPSLINSALDNLKRSGDARIRAFAQGANLAAHTGAAAGMLVGVAWRGTIQLDARTHELVVNVSGFERPIPLRMLQQAVHRSLEHAVPVNSGYRSIAHSNNIEAYLQGANPFDHAMHTRDPDGQFRNHGDPVANIAGRIIRVGWMVQSSGRYPRTNADARRVLEQALARDVPTLSASQLTLFTPQDRVSYPANPLTEGHRADLRGTLALLHRYGLAGLYGPKVQAAASRAAVQLGASSRPNDAQFVRNVFQGNFRPMQSGGSNLAWNLVSGLNRWAAMLGYVYAGPVADATLNAPALQRVRVAEHGLAQRLDRLEGGVLRAVHIDPTGLTPAQQQTMRQAVISALGELLRAQVGDPGANAQTLYRGFRALGSAQKAELGARVNAFVRMGP